MEKKELLAKKLLAWNIKHLISSSKITKYDIAISFAPEFTIKVNGREYEVNYESYLNYLLGFKSTIDSINYNVQEYVCNKDNVVIVMDPAITRLDGSEDHFSTMLMLKFNEEDKITNWQEVYVKK
ncbi:MULTISPECIES: hypothetical protein [Flammeovirga]|uniref:SnoaL-like domain-containing protein n=1 Tax=Flammeovirga agarivorans TaxID=2726742 RepID=A0A7X8XYS2_9BACT|nr:MULTISPECIES: hypothetical protein [Flammeovirga]NLR94398.1 hypothetical protein [Flammeovirga agarivorans]